MTPGDIAILDELKAYLDSNSISYSTEYDNFCLNFGAPNQVELEYVPSRSHAMAIPRFGLSGIEHDYFYKLSKRAEEQGSFKYYIKDFEWHDNNKREVIKSQILHMAGVTPHRFFARDTEVKTLSNKEVKQFQVENCFYGYRAASLNLGLVLKKPKHGFEAGTLLFVMTFGKNFFAKKEGYVEVFRVGTLKRCLVAGGASKLFKHFLEHHPTLLIANKDVAYERVVYYVDYDHGSGKSIDSMGFTWVRDSGGGFMNVDVATGMVSHRDPMNHKLIMKRIEAGELISVPNAGVKVYEHVIDPMLTEARLAKLQANKLLTY